MTAIGSARNTGPLVAAREMARAIGPQIGIVDEAAATAFHLRGFLNSKFDPAIFLLARRCARLGHAASGRLFARP
jgi:hypothetical protein